MKWTKERCFEIALTCNTRKELSEKSRTCYTTSHKNGWLEEICAHMKTVPRAKPNHWTKENCRKEAEKYETRSQFEKGCLGAYTKARRNDWLDEICTHMFFRQRGITGKKKVYTLRWEAEKMIYIGITNNPKRRINDHLKESSNTKVNELIASGKHPEIDIISSWIDINEISEVEQKTIESFRGLGWGILNIVKGGALGGTTVKWTKEKCFEQARKYDTRGTFEENESGCYKASLRLGIYDEVCGHMDFVKQPNGYWTKERCKTESLKYKSRTEFSNKCGSAYNMCLKNEWLDEICGHMVLKITPRSFWTYERAKDEALKYNTKGDFEKNSSSCYRVARENGWINEICNHTVKWNKEKSSLEAKKYNRRIDFQKGCKGAYSASLKNKWLDEFYPKNQ